MYRLQPSAWLKWAPALAGLPFLAATFITSPPLLGGIAENTEKALKSQADWATLEFEGRDATIRGDAPSQDAIDTAVKTVAGTYGVRRVTTLARIVEPVKMDAPTVESLSVAAARPEIKGTWPQNVAKTLAVTVAGKTYELNRDPELVSAGGNWTLLPSQAIADGAYDVEVEISDGARTTVRAASPGKLLVDTTAPDAPALDAAPADAKWPHAITGTWPEGDAATLKAELAGQAFALGTDSALVADGTGRFRFAPQIELPPGVHEITLTAADALGNRSQTKSVITVAAPQVAPEPAPAPETPPTPETPQQPEAAAPQEPAQPPAPAPETSAAATPEPALAPPDTSPPANPTVDAIPADTAWPFAITGTWPVGDAKSFAVELNGKTYTLGRDVELLTDTAGKFTFAPKVELAPGVYDLSFTLRDAAGNITNFIAPAAISVPEPPPPPAPAAPPPPELAAPTVEKLLDLTGAPVIRGTWDAALAQNLAVTVNGQRFESGKSANLKTAADGKWSVVLAKALPDGVFDVVAEATGKDGKTRKDETVGELEVDAVLPEVPAVESVASTGSPKEIRGTWGSAKARTLEVGIPAAGLAAKLGEPALVTDGDTWVWTLPRELSAGTYDVVVNTADRHGRAQADTTKEEVTVQAVQVEQPPPPPKVEQPAQSAPIPPPQPVLGCAEFLGRISNVFPIRFAYKSSTLAAPYDVALGQYTALLKDARCMGERVEISGHADDRGSPDYNLVLSEQRAQTVLQMLQAAGVDSTKFSVVGRGESTPADPATTEEARARNRRVEFRIVQ